MELINTLNTVLLNANKQISNRIILQVDESSQEEMYWKILKPRVTKTLNLYFLTTTHFSLGS